MAVSYTHLERYPGMNRLMITADGGGSNGSRAVSYTHLDRRAKQAARRR